jgi:hypothetical protein
VLNAREALKNRFSRKSTIKPTSKTQDSNLTPPVHEGKELRTWVTVSDKISKKDMEKVDVLGEKNQNSTIDIDRQKEIYLGGDNDVLEGFYNSDDEIDFENFKKGGKKNVKQGGGLFSKLTNAF